MIRDYQIASPSLEGVLNHDSLLYEGLRRPLDILRVLDGPSARGMRDNEESAQIPQSIEEREKTLETYFYDLYGVFMKKLSHFIVEADIASDDNVKLQALLQEMIKVKGLIVKGKAE